VHSLRYYRSRYDPNNADVRLHVPANSERERERKRERERACIRIETMIARVLERRFLKRARCNAELFPRRADNRPKFSHYGTMPRRITERRFHRGYSELPPVAELNYALNCVSPLARIIVQSIRRPRSFRIIYPHCRDNVTIRGKTERDWKEPRHENASSISGEDSCGQRSTYFWALDRSSFREGA
jgi:hypothetical protein